MKFITNLKNNLARTALTLLLAALTTTAWALEQDRDGYYVINTVQDWRDFATLVQTEPAANIRMEADIDLGDDQTTIGSASNPYQGTFDGQGYTLTVAYVVTDPASEYIAPFIAIQNATIQNLHVMGSITTAGKRHASITSYVKGYSYIKNCWGEVAITATRNDWIDGGGLVACIDYGNNNNVILHLSDCVFTGSITFSNGGSSLGGLVGWARSGSTVQAQNCLFAPSSIMPTSIPTNYSCNMLVNGEGSKTITNCYYNQVGASTNLTVQGMIATDRALAYGLIAYKLQNDRTDMVWGQRVGIDLFPVLVNDESYRLYKCNSGGCTNDPSLEYTGLVQDAGGWYLLGSEWAWQDFAEVVGANPTLSFNAKMTADIDLHGDQTTIATSDSYPYQGTFDGQGHALTVDYFVTNAASSYIAPFIAIQNATIQNLHVMGSITTVGLHHGSITGCTCHIRNCWSEVAITANHSGWIDGGGLVGYIYDTSHTLYLDDCVFTGSINYSNGGCSLGGFVGWARPGSYVYAQNCLFAPSNITPTSIPTSQYSSSMLVNGYQDYVYITNCYYNPVGASTNLTVQGTLATDEQLADGATATALQAGRSETIWMQDPILNQPMLKIFVIQSFTFDVAGYGTSTESDYWVFIASPVTGNITPSTVENLVADPATEYDLYRFNQSANKEWENYKNPTHTAGFVLENGKGYLYANKNNVTLTFIGTDNTGSSMDVDLDYDGNARLKGYNLVGNPFLTEAVINKNYYTMNAQGTGIVAEEVNSSEPIPPFTGVIVQATGENQSVTFTKTTRQSTTPSQGNLQIALAQANTRGNAIEDNAIVSFNEGSQLGKFYFGEQNANIYLPQGTEEYAIAYSDGHGEMPVNFRANENGRYTITVSPKNVEMNYLHIIDNKMGADVDLLQTPEYTFTAKTTDYESRFKLVFVSSSIGGDANGDNETFAFFSNGNWIIANEGQATLQVIDLNGRILSSETINGSVSKGINQPAGVYMIRLINGEDVKVQKVVVR